MDRFDLVFYQVDEQAGPTAQKKSGSVQKVRALPADTSFNVNVQNLENGKKYRFFVKAS